MPTYEIGARVHSAVDLLGEGRPEPAPVLIEGVLRKGGQMVIYGPPKAMKTQEMLYLALMLATGGPWRGHRCARSKVLYVSVEMDAAEVAERLRAMVEWYDLDPARLAGLAVVSLVNATISGVDTSDVEYVSERREEEIIDAAYERLGRPADLAAVVDMVSSVAPFDGDEPDVAMVDPISQILACDENDARAMNAAMATLARARGANSDERMSVIFAHHTGKGGGERSGVFDGMRGSSTIAGAVHAAVQIVQLHPRRGSETWREAEARGADPSKACYEMRFSRLRHFPDVPSVRLLAEWPVLREMRATEPVSDEGSREVAGGKANARRLEGEREKKTRAVYEAVSAALRANKRPDRASVYPYLEKACERQGIRPPSEKTFRTWTSNSGPTNWRVNPETGALYQVAT